MIILKWILEHDKAIALGFTAAGFLLSLFSIFSSCESRSDIERLNYIQHSMAKQPEFFVRQMEFRVVLQRDGEGKVAEGKDTISFEQPVKFDSATVKLWTENTGNAFGTLVAYATKDTITNDHVMRRELLKGAKKSDAGEMQALHGIEKGTTDSSLVLDIGITRPSDQRGMFHLLLVYENQWGQLYETYVWVNYIPVVPQRQPLGVKIQERQLQNGTTERLYTVYFPKFTETDFRQVVKYEKPTQIPYVYTKGEQEEMLVTFHNLFRKVELPEHMHISDKR